MSARIAKRSMKYSTALTKSAKTVNMVSSQISTKSAAPDPFAPAPRPERPELHLELRCNGDLIAASDDEKLWARVLALVLESEHPKRAVYGG